MTKNDFQVIQSTVSLQCFQLSELGQYMFTVLLITRKSFLVILNLVITFTVVFSVKFNVKKLMFTVFSIGHLYSVILIRSSWLASCNLIFGGSPGDDFINCLRPTPIFCALCPNYTPLKSFSKVGHRKQTVWSRAQTSSWNRPLRSKLCNPKKEGRGLPWRYAKVKD